MSPAEVNVTGLSDGTPSVALGIEFGEIARRKGYTEFGIDYRLLTRALRRSDHDHEDTPLVVINNLSMLSDLTGSYYADGSPNDYSDPVYDNAEVPDSYLALYTRGGYGPILPVVAAHEDEHHHNDQSGGENSFLSTRAIRLRKAAAALGSVMVGAAAFVMCKLELNTLDSAACAVPVLDFALCRYLNIEYSSRPEEQHAFDAESRAEVGDILLIDGQMSVKKAPSAIVYRFWNTTNYLKHLFVPNFLS